MEKQKEQIIVKSGWQKNSQIRINGRCRPKKRQKDRGDNVVKKAQKGLTKSDKIHKVQRVSSKREKKGGILSNERRRTIVSLKLRLLGDILKARKIFGWTQQEAAGMVRISLREYQNIEGGKCLPTTEVFLRLKFIYKLDIEEYSKEIGIDIPKMVERN